MKNTFDLSLYWLCLHPVKYRDIPAGTLWRVNKTWLDNLLYRSNPHGYHSTNYMPDEEDRRVEIQDIHSGKIVEMWASTLLQSALFQSWRPSDILIPEWNTGIIEFEGPEQLVHWSYELQGIIK